MGDRRTYKLCSGNGRFRADDRLVGLNGMVDVKMTESPIGEWCGHDRVFANGIVRAVVRYAGL